METPSSSRRRVTGSQTLAALSNNVPFSRRIEDSEKGVSKSRKRATKQEEGKEYRPASLIDITNDSSSPIVGLAKAGGLETPSSKQRSIIRANNNNTPGSGETLLRCQVKTLLQKVEEEADELSKFSLESRPFLHLQGFVKSPMQLLAPTPANTPQLFNLSEEDSINATASPVIQEQMIYQYQESVESSDTNLISRSLLLDFSEKTESTECSSVDDDDSSVWSIQVNASINDEQELVVEEEERLLEELCEEMSKIRVKRTMARFTGRHTRFLYNSDDEDEIVECVLDLPKPAHSLCH